MHLISSRIVPFILALFCVVNRYIGNLQPMPGIFPDYPAPVIRTTRKPRPR